MPDQCVGQLSYMASDSNQYICPGCQDSKPCTFPEIGGIHQAYRANRERKACTVIRGGKATDFRLRDSKPRPSARQLDLVFYRNLGPHPQRTVDYTLLFSGSFSGLGHRFDE
ncbi:hypothetical protein BJX64DRAFT_83825 [Aspergillus heterothallicus]